jgi:hypothetical protein
MVAIIKAEHQHSIIDASRLACHRLILLFNRCRGNPARDRPGGFRIRIPMINLLQAATKLRHDAKAHPSLPTLAYPRMHHIHPGRLTTLCPRYQLSLLHQLTGLCVPGGLVFNAKNLLGIFVARCLGLEALSRKNYHL